jgi:hypothetical protein
MGETGHCGGTPHSCGSEPAQLNILPDKSGVPAETMRWICCSTKVRPQGMHRWNTIARAAATIRPALNCPAIVTKALFFIFARLTACRRLTGTVVPPLFFPVAPGRK